MGISYCMCLYIQYLVDLYKSRKTGPSNKHKNTVKIYVKLLLVSIMVYLESARLLELLLFNQHLNLLNLSPSNMDT